jgi:hypothetical protein
VPWPCVTLRHTGRRLPGARRALAPLASNLLHEVLQIR